MANVIIDSCTYSNIVKGSDADLLVEAMIKNQGLVVRNFKIIRDELRKAPKQALTLYDNLVSNKMIRDSNAIANLADEYFINYRKFGGAKSQKEMLKDFKIVACASITNCDIIYSDDEHTMKSEKAMKAYKIVNQTRKHRMPQFLSYYNLKKTYLAS